MATSNTTPEKRTSKQRVHRAKRVVSAATPDIFGQPVGGFVLFLREHAIVGLAIGFVIGTQVQGLVKQLTDSFISPMFQLLFSGNKSLPSRTFTLHFADRHANFSWGAMAYALLNFFFVLAVMYALIKVSKLDKLDMKKK